MLKPLFKYAGGKFNEYKDFSAYTPTTIANYYEPFAGSCGVYLRLKNENKINGTSYINDISSDLMDFFKEVSRGTVGCELQKINRAWKTLKTISSTICYEFGPEFDDCVIQRNNDFNIEKISERIIELVDDSLSIADINWGGHNPSTIITKSLIDKIKRFSKKEITANTETITHMCISTAIYQGFYFSIRTLYNEWLTDENCTKYSNPEKAAQWFFIREMCYGSMFRFNSNGEFNIPYGGFSYNKKTLDDKIENITNQETINAFKDNVHLLSLDFENVMKISDSEDDFIFLDPPYDTTFSEYDNVTFGHKEHQRLANSLKNVRCKWMMVIKNTEFIYNLYKDWCNIMFFDKTYMYQARGRDYDKNVEHLVITNYMVD